MTCLLGQLIFVLLCLQGSTALNFWRASPTHQAVTVGGADLLSSYQCKGKSSDKRQCVFRNLVLWDGQIYYLTTVPRRTRLPVIEQDLLASDGNELNIKVVRPCQLPFLRETCESGATEENLQVDLKMVEHAVLVHRNMIFQHENFYHQFGEFVPFAHHMACQHFGLCDYKDRDMVTIVFTDGHPWPVSAAGVTAGYHCVAGSILHAYNRTASAGTAYVLQEAAVGVGSHCRAFHSCGDTKKSGDERPRPLYHHRIMESWRQRLFDCVGLGDRADSWVPQEEPLVVSILQRRPSKHRTIMNVADLVAALRNVSQPKVKVQVVDMDTLSFAQQAAVMSKSAIVFSAHGAALTNAVFMPKGGVVIEWNAFHAVWYHFKVYLADLKGIAGLWYMPLQARTPGESPVDEALVRQDKAFQALTRQEQEAVLDWHHCPEDKVGRHCKFFWLHKWTNHVVDVGRVVAAVQHAVERIHSTARDPEEHGGGHVEERGIEERHRWEGDWQPHDDEAQQHSEGR